MKLLKGRKIADKILADLKKAVKKQKNKPGLAVVLIGKNKASEIYVSLKKKAAEKVGISFYLHKFSERENEQKVVKKIKELNQNKKINGIIVQLPLPRKFNTQKIIDAISPEKDADGFHPENLKKFLAVKDGIEPVFPKAIIKMLQFNQVNLKNKQAVAVSNSEIFGKTMLVALKREKIRGKYILYKNYKKNLPVIKKADIIVMAVGKPGLVKGDMVKKGAIIIDGGITKIGKKISGDIDFESAKNKASYLSPVPGGVGPVTIACLLENVYLLHSAFLKSKKSR